MSALVKASPHTFSVQPKPISHPSVWLDAGWLLAGLFLVELLNVNDMKAARHHDAPPSGFLRVKGERHRVSDVELGALDVPLWLRSPRRDN